MDKRSPYVSRARREKVSRPDEFFRSNEEDRSLWQAQTDAVTFQNLTLITSDTLKNLGSALHVPNICKHADEMESGN